jgi:hypothetical protein
MVCSIWAGVGVVFGVVVDEGAVGFFAAVFGDEVAWGLGYHTELSVSLVVVESEDACSQYKDDLNKRRNTLKE